MRITSDNFTMLPVRLGRFGKRRKKRKEYMKENIQKL
jgi:hypothetical protein